MEKPKSPKFQTSTATYIISAHGTMLTSKLGTPQTKKYHAIDIPENVELYTFVDLGKCMRDYKTGGAYFICNVKKETLKEKLKLFASTAFKFIHEHGKTNKFPELFLAPDDTTPVHSYKGITHCIPEDYRTSTSRGHELIHNIDAKNTNHCICASIVSKSTTKPYNCEKNYSDYYKTQLKGYEYDPTSRSINKCGPILMSEAVKIIQAHSNIYYEPTCVIQIYVSACLAETDLKTTFRDAQIQYERTRRIAFPPPPPTRYADKACVRVLIDPHTGANPESEVCYAQNYAEVIPEPNKDSGLSLEEMLDSLKKQATTREVSESEINLMSYYYEIVKHNTLTKVSDTNVVESLADFKAIPLIQPLISKWRYMYQHKIFYLITYKDAYMEIPLHLFDEFSGTQEEIIDQIERKYRSRDRNKLDFCFKEALDLLKSDGSDDWINILPNINEINLVEPFIREENESSFGFTIYLQLKELIEKQKQKLKMGQGRRKKTLRQRKFPYVKKKSIKKKLTKKA